MKLNLLERKIIVGLWLRGDLPLTELADEIHEPVHKVRYVHASLLERNIIMPYLYINSSALGITEYSIYFSLLTHSTGARDEFVRRILKQARQVSWFSYVGGIWDFAVVFSANKVHDLTTFMYGLTRNSKLAYSKILSTQIRFTIYTPKYLGIDQIPVTHHVSGPVDRVHTIDELDVKILSELAKNSFVSKRQIAQRLGLSPALLDYHLKQMQSLGILRGPGLFVNASEIGCVQYRFLIACKRNSEQVRKLFENFCFHHRNAVVLIEDLGAWDFQIGAHFESEMEVPVFLDQLHSEFDGIIGEITTVPFIKVIRRNSFPFAESLN